MTDIKIKESPQNEDSLSCHRHELENNFDLFKNNHFTKFDFDVDDRFEKIVAHIQEMISSKTKPEEISEEDWKLFLEKIAEYESSKLA